ncbi:hypothetical protein BKA14_002826 [Actinoplanes abujensis]|uniref:Uncharacterized protein n=1 Tax=Paractinoplanes abujensis TaxID=882441 RepID=A0A7W7G022_9ACTN|nr:hypothetical protein [Actinoplanes abujensis]
MSMTSAVRVALNCGSGGRPAEDGAVAGTAGDVAAGAVGEGDAR